MTFSTEEEAPRDDGILLIAAMGVIWKHSARTKGVAGCSETLSRQSAMVLLRVK